MSPLSYGIAGEEWAPPVLLLHGFLGSREDWAEIIEVLQEDFLCLAPDLPGHGGSVGLPYPDAYTIEGAAREVTALLDGLGISRVALVGYSMGGRLALHLALRCPERFSGLLLESSSPGIESEEERDARREADERRARSLESGGLEGFLEEWYRQPLFASLRRREDLLGRTVEHRLSNDPHELARSLRAMGTGNQKPLWDELARIAVPVLAIAGELDEKYSGICSRMRTEGGVSMAVVPGAGHNVHLEAPDEYTRLLRGFLKAL